MVAIKTMLKSVLAIFLFSVLWIPSTSFAITYGSGNYGAHPYSDYTVPVSTPTPSTNGKGGIPVELLQKISDANKVSVALEEETEIPIPTSTTKPTVALKRNLKLTIKGDDVKALQVYLNSIGYTVATKGAGSKGKETTLFGPATKKAVISFQKANKLTADGIVGPKTRAVMGE